MKILWVNPSFLDYRVPFYQELNKLADGNFYLAYSKERVPERCINKIHNALENNALALEKEKRFEIGIKRSDFSCAGISIPLPSRLFSLLKTIEPDVIIAEGFFQWTPWALLRAKQLGVPFLIAYERTAHTERNCPWWRRTYRILINKFVDGYLVNGRLSKEYLEKIIKVRSATITEGVMAADSKSLAKKVQRLEIKQQHQGLRFLFVGRLIRRKGVDLLLQAWKDHINKHEKDTLTIVGDGPESENLKSIATDNIIFKGSVDYDSIHHYYAKADVFIIPTLEDNWSLVVPEAMACGLPIACSCYNGCYPELIKENINGKIFDSLKQESILEALDYFHHIDLISMSHASIEIERHFTPEACAKRAYDGICHTLNQRTNG